MSENSPVFTTTLKEGDTQFFPFNPSCVPYSLRRYLYRYTSKTDVGHLLRKDPWSKFSLLDLRTDNRKRKGCLVSPLCKRGRVGLHPLQCKDKDIEVNLDETQGPTDRPPLKLEQQWS